MIKNIKRIPTLNMSREEWLAERRRSIGGSDAAAVIGSSKWASPYSVWAEKRGIIAEKEENEAMRQGRDLEEYVARRFCEATGKKVRRENAILINPRYPFAHAMVDRMVVGESAGLECKTTSSLNVKRFRDVEFPEDYYEQCVHYMAVTGADAWYLAVVVLGREFHWYRLERDQAEIDALMGAEEHFWGYVERGEEPPVDGSFATADALDDQYPGDDGNEIDLSPYEYDIELYAEIGDQIADLKRRRERIANEIKSYMQENGYGRARNASVSWAAHMRESIDTFNLRQDYPQIAEKYTKKTMVRTFKINYKGDSDR